MRLAAALFILCQAATAQTSPMVADQDGNLYRGGAGGVEKLGPNHKTVVWHSSLVGETDVLAFDSAGALYAGGFSGASGFVAEIGPDGRVRSLIPAEGRVTVLQFEPNGFVLSGGEGFAGRLNLKTSQWEWTHRLPQGTQVRAIAPSGDGGAYVASESLTRLSADGQAIWTVGMGGTADSVSRESNGVVVVAGHSGSGTFRSRFDSNGHAFDSKVKPAAVHPMSLTSTITALTTTSPNPSNFGGQVQMTATISPNPGTGNVTFYDGAQVLAYVPIAANGAGYYTVTNLGSGTHSLEARYDGNGSYAASTSAPFTQTVNSVPEFGLTPGQPIYNNASYNVAVTKFDNTNQLYAVVANPVYNTVGVYSVNTSTTAWTLFGTYNVGHNPTAVAIADFNGDRYLDIAVTNYNDHTVTILLAVPNGLGGITGFTPSAASPVTMDNNPQHLAAGDFNGDGIPDLAVVDSMASGEVEILIGDGVGGFATAKRHKYSVGAYPWFVAVTDINGDGIGDLVMPCGGSNNAYVMLGNGDGTFSTPTVLTTGSSTRSVAIADFNGDGRPDLAFANYNNSTLTVYVQNSTGTGFNQLSDVTLPANSNPWSVVTADFNGDGIADLATSGYSSNAVYIFNGNGDGTFTQESGSPYTVAAGPSSLALGDFNADGAPDIVATSLNYANLSTLIGETPSKLAISTQPPASVIPNQSFSMAVQVEAANGTLLTGASPTVTLSSYPAGVSGNVSANAVNGIATFTGISLPSSGTYTITAGATGLASATSNSITVSAPSQLAFTSQPTTVVSGQTFSVTVQVEYSTGAVAPSSAAVTLTSSPQSLTGTTTVNAVNGVATFNNLSLPRGSNTLTATSQGLTSAVSSTISVTPSAPAMLVFTTAPSPAIGLGQFFQIQAAVADSDGNVVTGSNYAVTLSSTPAGLFGTTHRLTTAASGVANFNNLYFNAPGTYTITASSGSFAPGVSASFTVSTAVTLSVTPASSGTFGQLTALKASVPSNYTGTVTFYDGTVPLGTATVSNGVATLATIGLTTGAHNLRAHYNGKSINGDPGIAPVDSAWTAYTVSSVSSVGPYAASPISLPSGSASANPQFSPGSIATADFDGDGNADLAILDPLFNTVAIWLGNGAGIFTPAAGSPFAAGSGPICLVVADFNADGIPDLAIANSSQGNSAEISLLLGNGSGAFAVAAGSPFAVSNNAYSMAVGDFNNDGRPDIAVAGSSSLAIMLGNSSGGLTAGTTIARSQLSAPNYTSISAVAVADLNSDGLADIVMSTGNHLYGFLGDGTGNFAVSSSVFLVSGQQSDAPSVAIGDFNGDGVPDVAVAEYLSGSIQQLGIYIGNGSGGFSQASGSPISLSTQPTQVIAVDIDGDGKTDLAVGQKDNSGNGSATLAYFKGNGQGGFSTPSWPAQIGSDPLQAWALVALDFNGDGRTDLATLNAYNGAESVSLLTGSGFVSLTGTHSGNFALGQTGAQYTLKVSNLPNSQSGDLLATVTDTVPAGLTMTGMSGSGWTCHILSSSSGTCYASMAISSAFSPSPITVTVNVAANAPALLVNQASVSFQLVYGSADAASSSIADPTNAYGPAVKLGFTSGGYASGAPPFTMPPFTVAVEDVNGSIITGASAKIAISAENDGYPHSSSQWASGTLSANTVNGVATFSHVGFAQTGSYHLTATATGLTKAVTAANSIVLSSSGGKFSLDPSQLSITSQPSFGVAGQAIGEVEVQELTAQGQLASASTDAITITSSPAGVIGTTTLNAAGGIAGFNGLIFPTPGTYTLTASTSTGLTPAVSTTITIGSQSSALTLISSTASSAFGGLVTLTATATPLNATGNATFYDGANLLGDAPFSNGVAILGAISLTPGTHAIYATGGGIDSNTLIQTVTASPGTGFLTAPSIPFAGAYFVKTGSFTNNGQPYVVAVNNSTNQVAVYAGSTQVPGSPYSTGNAPTSAALVDVNGDGFNDLAITNYGDNTVTVLLSTHDANGNLTGFTPLASGPISVGNQPSSIAAGDFNGDGVPDLAVANFSASSNSVTILLGNGSGGFTQAPGSPFAVGGNPWFVTVTDFNGDGVPDLAVSNGSSSNVSILLGNGDGTFYSYATLAAGSSARSIAVGDFNGDGQPDLAVANYNDNTVTVYLQNMAGSTFVQQPTINLPSGTNPWTVAAGDFNGDGVVDLAVTGFNSNQVFTFLGNGSGGFSAGKGSPYGVNAGPGSLAIADLNGDGVADIVASSASGNLTVLLGQNANKLAFTTQPQSSAAQGATLNPVMVTVEDASGNLVVGSTAAVTISSSPSGVSGTLTVNAVNGVATFTNLVLASGGTYTLTAASAGLTSAVSGTITVAKSAPTITWNAPAGITYGTALSAAQLNATASAPGIFVYSPAAGTVLTAGTQTLSVTFTPTDSADYSTAMATVTISVGKATPTITWAAPSGITYGTALSATQLNAAASVPGTFVYSPAAGVVLTAGSNQTLSVTFTPTDATDYNSAPAATTLNVGKATPTITWNAPAGISYGTALSATQLNATASVSGTFVYSPAAGTVLTAGTQTLSVTFTPTDSTDYSTATGTTTINVGKPTPTITWNAPAAITYGTPLSATQLNATASVPGTFVYTPAAGTVLTAGKGQTLSVTFTPTDAADYSTASASTTISVQAALPVITWANPVYITYGTPLSAVQLNATASVAGTFAYSPAAGTVLTAGADQTLTVVFTPTDSNDYRNATATSAISVLPATPVVTWSAPTSIAYGTALSATQLNATASVPGKFVYNPAAGTVLTAGMQALSVTFTPTDSTDYNTVMASTTITVNAVAQQPTDVSSQVKVTSSGLVYSRATGAYTGTVTIQNIGSTAIGYPIQAVFTNLISGATLAGASGAYMGAPYITLTGTSLAPGASVSFAVKLTYSGTSPISYVLKTLSGGF